MTYSQKVNQLQVDTIELSYFGEIIDSINYEFQNNELRNINFAQKQAICDIFHYDGELYDEVMMDISTGMDFFELNSKYHESRIFSDQLIVIKSHFDSIDGEHYKVTITPIELYASSLYISKVSYQEAIENGKLITNLRKKYSSKTGVSVIQLKEIYPSSPLPENYQRKVQYFTSIMGEEPFFESKAKMPSNYDSVNIDTLNINQKRNLLSKSYNNEVIGFCGSDNLALNREKLKFELSAATGNFEVFIRSLLNIISDNVKRMSDDSFSMSTRDKYYFDIRNLNINHYDFYLGSYFKYEQIKETEVLYWSLSLARILNTIDNENSLNEILKIVNDSKLDILNRYRFLVLAHRLNKLSPSKEKFESNLKRINIIIDSFPKELASKLKK